MKTCIGGKLGLPLDTSHSCILSPTFRQEQCEPIDDYTSLGKWLILLTPSAIRQLFVAFALLRSTQFADIHCMRFADLSHARHLAHHDNSTLHSSGEQ